MLVIKGILEKGLADLSVKIQIKLLGQFASLIYVIQFSAIKSLNNSDWFIYVTTTQPKTSN